MHPKIWGSVDAYSVFLVLADAVGWATVLYCGSRAGIKWRRLVAATALLTVGAFLGAKAYGLIERGGSIGSLGYEITAGYRYPGGLIGFAAAVWLVSRRSLLDLSPGLLADVVTPAFGFSLAVVRGGCLLAGCCFGRFCELPWAIHFPAGSQPWRAQIRTGLLNPDAPMSLPVHPLQLYFAIVAGALGLLALWLQSRKAYDGQVFLVFVLLYGGAQFLLEFVRFGPLPHVQYMALVSSMVAALVLVISSPGARRPIRVWSLGSLQESRVRSDD